MLYLLISCHWNVSSLTARLCFLGCSISNPKNSIPGTEFLSNVSSTLTIHKTFSWTVPWSSWVISLFRLFPFIIIKFVYENDWDIRNKKHCWAVSIWNCWWKSNFLYQKKCSSDHNPQYISTLSLLINIWSLIGSFFFFLFFFI